MTAQCILAVEDDAATALLYEGALRNAGFMVRVAPSLAEASRALDEGHLSLVLLDLFLPDGDGRAWLRELRLRPEHAATPVIVIAGNAIVESQVECYELGATLITKPVVANVLVAAVSAALSRSSVSRSAPPRRSPAPSEPRPATVLQVEDDDVVAALVNHRLKREGFTVLRARDGVTALEMARGNPIGLAILDVMVPGFDGFELLTRLRADPVTRRIPVIMLTGLGGERDIERALALGASDYMIKPFSPVELTARVNRLLRAAR